MFLFRFLRYMTFKKTEEWQQAYDKLCKETDYLYFRDLEKKGNLGTLISAALYMIASWWVAFSPLFKSAQMYVLATIFTIVFLLYFLNTYTYIPMEIVETQIAFRVKQTRKPTSTAKRKLRERKLELNHEYYLYTTTDGKKCIDMTDRVLCEDQGYNEEEWVFRFSGPTKEYDYVLPRIADNDTVFSESKETLE